MSDLTTSIKEIFNERISSPFYGSLIVSWLLWNWEIPYVTFFVDGAKLGVTKIEFIKNNFDNPLFLILFPLISTVLIIWVLPLITNLAYKITLEYDNKRIKQKNEIEGKRLLTLEESMKLRLELQNLQENYASILNNKEKEITSLKEQLKITLVKPKEEKKSKSKDDLSDLQNFLTDEKFNKYFENIVDGIRKGHGFINVPKDVEQYYLAYDIIQSTSSNTFGLTRIGELYYKEYLKQKLSKQKI